MRGNQSTPVEVRFRNKFVEGATDECWNWLAARNRTGYGWFRVTSRENPVLAHRFAYELHHGITVTPGTKQQVVMHTCDNPGCVNPSHLRLGTMAENCADRDIKGRHQKYPLGSAHHNSKMTEELVARHRQHLAAGKTISQLSRETGLDRKTLTSMRDRKNWKHVP